MKNTSRQMKAMKSVRKSWDFNPAPRKVESKKVFKRNAKFRSRYYCDGYVD